MREKKRLLEIAGLDAKRILREAKEIDVQVQFDDESDRKDFMRAVKKYGLKARPGGEVRGKAQDELVYIEIPRAQAKLFNFLVDYMGYDEEDIEDMYPELSVGD